MRVFEKTFTNEFQNSVSLTLDHHCKPSDQPSRITITLAGPHSTSENTITLQEARELRAALDDVLF